MGLCLWVREGECGAWPAAFFGPDSGVLMMGSGGGDPSPGDLVMMNMIREDSG